MALRQACRGFNIIFLLTLLETVFGAPIFVGNILIHAL
ncbi:hypothetical protein KSP9073_01190 [Kushneria phyllosphaerae]|uniref:Uncharacterized protein n=1 Tax=Kushneria phyllosphaerae TaxID=2100822 RepID=A0A2R8CJW9_9GAMM|nr:hypothetical protein KSP9073_01190 [Kushneria phyllosphaerae]